jgi:hypothetical protein
VEKSFVKGGLGEKCRAESSRWLAQVTLPLASDSHGSSVSAVLTIQKIVLCLQVCLALGHCDHHSGCSDSILGDLLVAF